MNLKSVVLFGGSFDPPHLGHQIIIQQALELLPQVDELWLLPTYNHSFAKNLTPAPHRRAMCQKLIDDLNSESSGAGVTKFSRTIMPPEYSRGTSRLDEGAREHENLHPEPPKIKICPIEIDYHTSGSTYETWQLLQSETNYLQKIFPYSLFPIHYSFLLGSDQLPVFTKWQHWQDLLKAMPFYVYPRANCPLKPLLPGMIALTAPTQIITNISSTLIKARLQQHLPVNHLLPPSIQRYITLHSLYGNTRNKIPTI